MRATVQFLRELLRHKHVDAQLHLLAPLAETPITTQFKEQLIYDNIFSDISPLGWEQEQEDRTLIAAHRDIFPNFYAVPTRWIDRRYLVELREFILRGVSNFRWLMLMLHRDAGDLLRVFDEWMSWKEGQIDAAATEAPSRDYYVSERFPRELLRFTRTRYIEDVATHPQLVSTMAELEAALCTLRAENVAAGWKGLRKRAPKPMTCGVGAVPTITDEVTVIQVNANYKRLVRCLTRNERLEGVPTGRFALMLSKSSDKIRITQLNPAMHQLLSSCDGSRTLLEVARCFSPEEKIEGIPAVKVGLYGLNSLLRRRLIEIKAQNFVTRGLELGDSQLAPCNSE